MADAQSVLAKSMAAADEASDLAGVARPGDQIATLQTALTASQNANQALQAKINAAKAAAQADKDADAANAAGQGVLDALS